MTDATDTENETSTVAVTINGSEIAAQPGELVIDAAERNGVYIPHFCYHPRMRPVGMCRMCIVEIDTGRGPALQPSCMLECTDGMVVDTESPATKKAQDGVLEFLLINHPLDCPVCDKGGECPLQDQTMAYGPGESRFVEEKRHHAKPIPISETVYLDRERCILCDRCTRFADEVAGDPLINFQQRGANTEVNTFPDEPFASYFSGNTVQICPVGALTAKPFRFRARPWDLQYDRSTCTSCSVGCRVSIETSRDDVLRYQGVDVDPVNWGWLCDKGRFDFQHISSDDRIAGALVRPSGADRSAGADALVEAPWSEALDRAADALRDVDPERVAVLGGAQLTNEDAYAWAKLAKGVIGTDHVDAQLGDGLPAAVALGLPAATIDQACAPGGTVVLLAPDLKDELPVLHLRLRHAAVNDGVRLVELSARATGLTPHATASLRYRPGDAAAAARALIAGDTAAAADLGLDPEALTVAHEALGQGPVTVVLGRPSLAESGEVVAEAAVSLADAFADAGFLLALRRANVRGALDLGLAPGLLPGRVALDDGRGFFADHWDTVPGAVGHDAAGVAEAAAAGAIDVLVLLGADPLVDLPDRDLARRAFAGVGTVIALDQFVTESVAEADVVLGVAGYAECTGTTTNIEGRVSALAQRVNPPGTTRSDWMIAAELAQRLGADLGLESIDAIAGEIAVVSAVHADVFTDPAGLEGDGVLAAPAADGDRPAPLAAPGPVDEVDRPAVDAYSLRLVSGRTLYDAGTVLAHSPSIAGLAEPATVRVNPVDFDKLGIAEGDEVRVTSARGSITVPAHGDREVPMGVAVLPFNQPGAGGGDLIDSTQSVTDVRLETVVD
jgi:NADH-quinone oxidoreductase subunit G